MDSDKDGNLGVRAPDGDENTNIHSYQLHSSLAAFAWSLLAQIRESLVIIYRLYAELRNRSLLAALLNHPIQYYINIVDLANFVNLYASLFGQLVKIQEMSGTKKTTRLIFRAIPIQNKRNWKSWRCCRWIRKCRYMRKGIISVRILEISGFR